MLTAKGFRHKYKELMHMPVDSCPIKDKVEQAKASSNVFKYAVTSSWWHTTMDVLLVAAGIDPDKRCSTNNYTTTSVKRAQKNEGLIPTQCHGMGDPINE